MSDISALERRITLRLIAYWERLRAGRMMPSESDIKPEDLQDLWEYCFLIHVKNIGGDGYDYTYLGDALQMAGFGGEFIQLHGQKRLDDYKKVIETATPLFDEGELVTPGFAMVKYRQCLLPLGSQGQVEAIFGGIRFKVFAK